MMGIVVPETCWVSNKIYNKNHLLNLVGILFPHINDDARSKSHQIRLFVCGVRLVYGTEIGIIQLRPAAAVIAYEVP